MASVRELRGRLPGKGFALVILALLGVSLVLLSGIGPDWPGPRLRVKLGLADQAKEIPPCAPSPARTRAPSDPPPPGGTWRAEPDFPAARVELRGAVAGGRAVLVGGQRAEDGSSDSAYFYDPRTRRYRDGPPMPMRLDHTLALHHDGHVYVVGGFRDSEPTRRMWRLSLESGRWEELPPMRVARGGLGGAVIDGRLYAAGGVGRAFPDEYVPPYRTVEVYDIARRRWRDGPPMRTERHHFGSAALDGKLYAIGGRRSSDFSMREAERLDPRTGSWERVPPLPDGAGGFEATAARGELIAVGGGDDDGWQEGRGWVSPAVWALHPGRGRWRRLPDLRTPRHGHALAVLGDRLYAFAGAPCPGFGFTAKAESLALD